MTQRRSHGLAPIVSIAVAPRGEDVGLGEFIDSHRCVLTLTPTGEAEAIGSIYLCIDDAERSWLAGTFPARVVEPMRMLHADDVELQLTGATSFRESARLTKDPTRAEVSLMFHD